MHAINSTTTYTSAEQFPIVTLSILGIKAVKVPALGGGFSLVKRTFSKNTNQANILLADQAALNGLIPDALKD